MFENDRGGTRIRSGIGASATDLLCVKTTVLDLLPNVESLKELFKLFGGDTDCEAFCHGNR